MRENTKHFFYVAALVAIPAVALGQYSDLAHVERGTTKNKKLQKSHDDEQVLPADIWYNSLWIVDTDAVDSGNGAAISGMSIFGVVYDLSLADDFASPGGTCTLLVHDYMNFNGGGYSPETDYLIEFFADTGGAPANTASTILTSTTYASSVINISWWGPGTRTSANISVATVAGINWVSPSPVDITPGGDWYYGCRKYATGFFGDAHGRDGGVMHGGLYGGPYDGGYGTDFWTSMDALGFTAGDWSMQACGNSGGGGFSIDFTGDCSTSFDIYITGGNPGAKCAFAYGKADGSTPIPPCPGLSVDIDKANAWRNYPDDVLLIYLDENGDFSYNKAGGAAFCDKAIQVVDLDNCIVSNRLVLKWCLDDHTQPCIGYCDTPGWKCQWSDVVEDCLCK